MNCTRLFLVILFSVSIVTRNLTNCTPYGEDEEDDEDIFKHFEDLLKGSKTNDSSKSVEHEELPKDRHVNQPNEELPSTDDINVPSDDDDYSSKDSPAPTSSEQPASCQCKKYFECNVSSGKKENDNFPVESNENSTDIMEVDVRWGDSIRSTCAHYFDVCCESIRDNTTEIRNPEYEHTLCGKRNLQGVGFRVKGAVNQEAQFGEFPWMAAIVTVERQEGKPALNVFVCGGSLIHPGVVLTAAHCVATRKPEDLVVRLGEWDTQTTDELYPHKDHQVIKINIHEDYYSGGLYNDIALLFLNGETKISPHIDTACLPPANVNFDGKRCYASGWGRDSYGKEGRYQVILKKLDLPIVSRDYCEYSLKRTRLGRYFRLHESFVCAGGEKGRDTCRGDGGSPLVCNVPGSDSYVMYGIVAWGIGCGEEGVPGVYVNVPKFVPWISKKMTENRLNTKYFKLGRKLF